MTTYEKRIVDNTRAYGEHEENKVEVLRHFENSPVELEAFCKKKQLTWEEGPKEHIRFSLLQQNRQSYPDDLKP